MPHVITQWEAMAWRRDDPDWNRVSRMSIDLRESHSPSTPRRAQAGFRSCEASPSQQSLFTPSSVFSSTFNSRSSPSSSISSTPSFKPVFELEDTSSPIQQRPRRSLAAEQDSLKITVYSPDIAAMDLPSPARYSRGRLQSVAITSKVGEHFAVLDETIYNLTQQLSTKDRELAAKDKDLIAAIRVAEERQHHINSLTEQVEHCLRYHPAPPTPPKESSARTPRQPAPRPVTAGHHFSSGSYATRSASDTNLSAGFRISDPLPGSFRKTDSTSGLSRPPALIPLSEAAEQQTQRRRDVELRQQQRQQRPLLSAPSMPSMSGENIRPVHRRSAPEMIEKKKGGILGKLGRKKEKD